MRSLRLPPPVSRYNPSAEESPPVAAVPSPYAREAHRPILVVGLLLLTLLGYLAAIVELAP